MLLGYALIFAAVALAVLVLLVGYAPVLVPLSLLWGGLCAYAVPRPDEP